MNSSTQQQIELSAVLNLVPYLDTYFDCTGDITLSEVISQAERECAGTSELQSLKSAYDTLLKQDPSIADIMLVDQSCIDGSVKDDFIQAYTFKDPKGDYYVTYRGTGDGRWADNGKGLAAFETEMQAAAREYFDRMAEKYFIDAHSDGNSVFVTGHSKGGNEAQHVYMTSKYDYLIDQCYSYDGQGFSDEARDYFIERYGADYEKKLSGMYSICGENDFVHDMGNVIIPEENTYFVKTSGEGAKSFHALEYMITDGNGNYRGLQWDIRNGEITHGEQGYWGKFAARLSRRLMKMNPEDLEGVAVAVMSFIDVLSGNEVIGTTKWDLTDLVDLLAHGLPAGIETLLFTEEGNVFLKELITEGLEKLYDEHGVLGIVVAALGVSIVCVALGPIILKTMIAVVCVANILDFIFDLIDAKHLPEKIRAFIEDIKKAFGELFDNISEKIKSLSYGYKYATEKPQISLNTYKLDDYAARLRDVNSCIVKIDRQMNSLYGRVGLKDLWELLKADALTGYSHCLRKCAEYLEDTSSDFSKLEHELICTIE